MEHQTVEARSGFGTEHWPIEVRALVASLRVQHKYMDSDRRRQKRQRYEIQTTLWCKGQTPQSERETIYTRDVTKREIAFVCASFFKIGQSVILDLPGASGATQRVQGYIRRCRQVSGGWFDCMMEFQKTV